MSRKGKTVLRFSLILVAGLLICQEASAQYGNVYGNSNPYFRAAKRITRQNIRQVAYVNNATLWNAQYGNLPSYYPLYPTYPVAPVYSGYPATYPAPAYVPSPGYYGSGYSYYPR
jgi:hypothetical protein